RAKRRGTATVRVLQSAAEARLRGIRRECARSARVDLGHAEAAAGGCCRHASAAQRQAARRLFKRRQSGLRHHATGHRAGERVVTPEAPPSPPSGTAEWTSQDIGAVGLSGGATPGGGAWTVTGAGSAAVWGTADAFQFVHQPLGGDGQITVRVDSLQNTTPFA